MGTKTGILLLSLALVGSLAYAESRGTQSERAELLREATGGSSSSTASLSPPSSGSSSYDRLYNNTFYAGLDSEQRVSQRVTGTEAVPTVAEPLPEEAYGLYATPYENDLEGKMDTRLIQEENAYRKELAKEEEREKILQEKLRRLEQERQAFEELEKGPARKIERGLEEEPALEITSPIEKKKLDPEEFYLLRKEQIRYKLIADGYDPTDASRVVNQVSTLEKLKELLQTAEEYTPDEIVATLGAIEEEYRRLNEG